MRHYVALRAVLVALLLSSVFPARAVAPQTIRFRDTLRTEAQRSQFRKALELAPSSFVYDSYNADGRGSATVHKLRLNDTMRNILKLDFIQADPFLHKQMRRLYVLSRPFNVSGDLAVRYHQLPGGAIALQYEISELYIWGRRASDRLIRELLKANGVAQ